MTDHLAAFKEAVRTNKIIDAIKAYRLWKNVGFKEASDYIQSSWVKLRYDVHSEDEERRITHGPL